MHLEQLSNAFGVSGAEGEVRKIILEAAKPYADEWRIDTMGNLFIHRRPGRQTDKPAKRVMVTAHMDEVGFMISAIKDNGHLKFKPIGSFDRRILLGKAVVVGEKRLPGVIGLKPIHLLDREEEGKVDKIDTLYIDVGATDSEAEGKVKVGDFAAFATRFGPIGERWLKGKAFDNRAGCAVLLELLKEDYPIELIAVFTVQEEIGLRGARVAAYAADPALAFILEGTAADDLPDPEDEEKALGIPRLEDGPAITVMDRSFIADRSLVDLLIETAETEGLPYQFKRPGIGGTDAGAVHLARDGVPAVAVSVPVRYIHSPAGILSRTDFEHTVRLVRAALNRLGEQ